MTACSLPYIVLGYDAVPPRRFFVFNTPPAETLHFLTLIREYTSLKRSHRPTDRVMSFNDIKLWPPYHFQTFGSSFHAKARKARSALRLLCSVYIAYTYINFYALCVQRAIL